jgi:ATP-dependent DNA helicase RecQ
MGGKYPGADAILAVRDALKAAGAADVPAALARIQELTPSVAKTKVRSVLAMMKDLGLVRQLRGSHFRLQDKDVPEGKIEEIAAQYAARQENDRDKLERMSLYAQGGQCRWRTLLDYFGEGEAVERCGTCDNCVRPPETHHEPPVDRERQTFMAELTLRPGTEP